MYILHFRFKWVISQAIGNIKATAALLLNKAVNNIVHKYKLANGPMSPIPYKKNCK